MGVSHRYDPVDQVDDNKDEPQPQVVRVHVSTPWWKFLLCNILAACAGATLMFLATRYADITHPSDTAAHASDKSVANVTTHASTTSSANLAVATPYMTKVEGGLEIPPNMDPIILDCGFSADEARAKGCVYDVMMQDWVPEPCYDSVLTERYLAKGNYTWYSSGDGKNTMSDEEMRKGNHDRAWMSTSYHKDHCVFSWMKIIRALRNNWGISQELLSYDHVLHCSHGALKEVSDDTNLGVSAPTNYAKCALYNTWRQNFIPDTHNSTS